MSSKKRRTNKFLPLYLYDMEMVALVLDDLYDLVDEIQRLSYLAPNDTDSRCLSHIKHEINSASAHLRSIVVSNTIK